MSEWSLVKSYIENKRCPKCGSGQIKIVYNRKDIGICAECLSEVDLVFEEIDLEEE